MARRLIVCADGTWNTPTQEDGGRLAPTNVAKLYEAVHRTPAGPDGVAQLAFYHEGVGAGMNAFERVVDRVADFLHIGTPGHNLIQGMTGQGLDANIRACYRWLVQSYQPGDRLYFFGFSRGAYTVRSLAGLVRNSGLVTRDDDDLIDKAFALYRDRSPGSAPGSDQATQFRRLYAREPEVRCVGVWDTVGALGIPLAVFAGLNAERYQFHDVSLSSRVGFAFQALAIDERRKPFAPALWEQQPGAAEAGQVLEQRWFAGAHSNVGGGYADCGLSDTALLWMLDGARRAGLAVDDAYVAGATGACWDGALRDSMSPAFALLGAYTRPIADGRAARGPGAAAPDVRREQVDASALRRLGECVPADAAPYAPPNLIDYVRRFPSPRAVPPGPAAAMPTAGPAAGAPSVA